MRIGVDVSCWASQRGFGRFVRELIPRMMAQAPDDEFLLYLDEPSIGGFEIEAPNGRRILVPQSAAPTRAAASSAYRSPLDLLRFTRALWRERPDVFFSPSVYTYFPVPPGVPTVVAVHDTIPERHPELTLPTWRDRLFWRAKVGLALHQARLIVTVSEFAAREIREVLRVDPARIRVVYEGPASVYRPSDSETQIRAVAERLGLPSGARWFVYVGGFNPHKRLDVLVRAHATLARELGDEAPYLLLVGSVGREAFLSNLERIRRLVAESATEDRVRWTGYLPDEDLRHLHSGSLALVLPSEREGFGLPAVEAAACGAPVIATTESPLPELLDGGGIYVRPGDVSDLAAALRRLLVDDARRREMGARAFDRASRLSWERSAELALHVLREAAA